MKVVALFLTFLFVYSTPAFAEKNAVKVEVKKENPHKNLHLYFLDRRPYTAPKNDNTNKTSS